MSKPVPSDRELDLLKVMWQLGEAKVRDIHEAICPDGQCAFTTVQTLVRIMCKKGLVKKRAQGRTDFYTPVYTLENAASRFVDKLYDGAVDKFVLSMLTAENVSADEMRTGKDDRKSPQGETKERGELDMLALDFLFDSLMGFLLLAFLLLGASVLTLRWLPQPLERIRLIQISLACIFLAAIFSHVSWKPSIALPVLPGNDSPILAEQTSTPGDSSSQRTAAVRGEAEFGYKPANVMVEGIGDADAASAAAPIRWHWWRMTQQSMVFGFIGISVLQAVYLLVGFGLTRRLIARASPLSESGEERIRHLIAQFSDRVDIRFVSSDEIDVPLASGILRPTILLPTQLASDDADPLLFKHSLAHEWKHIEQNDLITWQLVTLCQVLLWPQPFYWLLCRELRVSQDQIADEFAARETNERAAYAATLVEFSRTNHSTMLGALTMAGTRSNLYRRVEMLLNSKFRVSGFSRKRIVFGFTGLMATSGLLLASFQWTEAAATENGTTDGEADQATATGSETGKPRDDNKLIEEVATASVEHFGFVFDAKTDEPIDGATVVVTRMNSGDWRELAVTESTTDASGKYTFSIPPEQLQQRLLYIMFDLRHPTYAPQHCGSYGYGMIAKNLKLGTAPWFSKLYMTPGAKVSGRLVDEGGSPVAGAQLRAHSMDSSVAERTQHIGSFVEAVSDEAGRFEIGVTREGIANLSVIPIDQCMKHIELGTKRGDLGDIPLATGSSIRGRVLDAAGNPMAGVWVNLTKVDDQQAGSYEMKRSSKSNERGEFQTRPISPGNYSVDVESKATGALEKQKYANFHDDPLPAMFVKQIIDVSRESSDKPFVIQAVPHVYIRGSFYNSSGELIDSHSPSLMGKMNDQFMWIRQARRVEKGAFELMVPHGVENATLNFTTNEHSGLTVQFGDESPSPHRRYTFKTIEEDIANIRIVRYVAPILQVNVVDEQGNNVQDATVGATYAVEREPPKSISDTGGMEMMTNTGAISFFEEQPKGIYQSSSLAPGFEFDVYAEKDELGSRRPR